MKSYKLENWRKDIFWFSKEPIKFSGPRVKFKDGEITRWSKHLHREDGPALEYADGTKYWYWHGQSLHKIYSQEEFERWKKFRNFQ